MRDDLIDEHVSLVKGFFAVDQQFADVFSEIIPNGPQNDVVLCVKQFRRFFLLGGRLHGIPEL